VPDPYDLKVTHMSTYENGAIVPTQYDDQVGVLFDPDGDFSLNVHIVDGAVTIFGNRDGLRSLAQLLVDLAEPSVPLGHHVHLSSTVCLGQGSASIAVVRQG
jgi:hypothetical protein